ncbi:PIG-L family deacetylase [soil metagenome]
MVAAPDLLPPLPEAWDRGLAVVAHPEDLEYGAASAVARGTDQGKQVTYVLASRGEAGIDGMGPAEASRVREAEQRASAAVVGVDTVEFLGLADGVLEPGLDLRRRLARAVRRHRPEVLVSINFRLTFGGTSFNMTDHRVLGVALLDAARDAANRWVFTDLVDEGHEPWAGTRLACFGGSPEPTHAVDVTGWLDRGVASLAEHRAYLTGLGDGGGGGGGGGGMADPDAFLRPMAEAAGRAAGVTHAVTFEVFEL